MASPRLSTLGLVLLLLSGCSESSLPEKEAPAAASAVVEPVVLPDDALRASLGRVLERVLSGDDPILHLVGDRLIVITAETFSELPVRRSDLFLASEFSLGGGCSGPCVVTLRSFLEDALVDLRQGRSSESPLPRPRSLERWSPVTFTGENGLWRVHLATDGSALVSIEFFPTQTRN